VSGAALERDAERGVGRFLEAVERRLSASVGAYAGAVAVAGSDTLAAGGKRMRPALVFLAAPARARGRPGLAAAAAAIELVHMATLVHDDQIDRSRLRRGRETVWSRHGERVSGATGDYLFARAFAELTSTGDVVAVTALSDACVALARGEALQREQARDVTAAPEAVLERCRLKTGRLFAAAAVLGGHLGGLPSTAVARLDAFGESLGLAFQLDDDALDCDGDPETTGKPLGADLLDGTVTIPLLVAGRRDPEVAAVIRRGAGPSDVLPTLARVARTGALAETRALAERHATAALAHLDGLDGALDTGGLRAVVGRAVGRRA
jgi:geranylgeranyl pyrophosphate synthase